ncbi:MAG: endonuclease III [Sulfurovum sp.]|nr:endonuclease III [Sulfurovum sp.]MCB4750484.1 endonuclease III [Sulfurovum sp.]MCB4753291.1 endonuclease III [Sulfurovum sp.]MCB4754369.1 endonuclease III [Sulfurovum sp.]MCB4761424.1 endonuclease III [Sulfurovum sp.]
MTKKVKKATKQEIEKIKKLFLEHYPNSVTELKYKNLYELLVSVMLSAQCTDKRVNIITPTFFKHYPNPALLANADLNEVKSHINTCSFFNNKAKNLIKMAQNVVENYEGNIPLKQKELVKLAGVGQKTANVVMIEYTGANLMAVDTHVYRVAHRLGLCDALTAIKCEEQLVKKFKTDLHRLHQAMVLFGRYRCKALKPECNGCFMQPYCKTTERFKV